MMRKMAKVLTVLMILMLCVLPVRAEAESTSGVPAETASGVPAESAAAGKDTQSEESPACPDNGIPVLVLTIDPEEFQKVLDSSRHEYQAENGTIRIDLPAGWTGEYGVPDEATVGTELSLRYFRGRGNSTWFEDKKPFKFRLEESMDLLGMGANEHWVLLANAKDDSLLRNRLAGYIGDALGLAYTSRSVPGDLIVNGEYLGSYLLCEQVRVGENRVEIDKIKKSQTEEPEISGGYLLSMAPSEKDPDAGKLTLTSGLSFLVESPELDEYDDTQQETLKAQKDYITAYLQAVEDAVFGEGFRNADGAAVSELMDLESAAKYWWVQCFSYNDDGFNSTSTYLYKERDGKLYWGPLWDFDRSFWLNDRAEYLNNAKMPWLDHLRANDPEYQRILRAAWDSLDEILKEVEKEGGVLDRYKEEIRLSWEKDYELRRGRAPKDAELDRIVEDIRQNIRLRREAIEAIIDTELTNVFAEVTFTYEGQVLAQKRVYIGETLSADDFPQPPQKEGFEFLGWGFGGTEPIGRNTRVLSDMTVRAEYGTWETAPPETAETTENAENGKGPAVLIAAGIAAVLVLIAGVVLLVKNRRLRRTDN